jgi:hypothetical protein
MAVVPFGMENISQAVSSNAQIFCRRNLSSCFLENREKAISTGKGVNRKGRLGGGLPLIALC